MIDAPLLILSHVLADATLASMAGDRVFAERNVPPPGYRPADGPCITFKIRGGGPDYEDALLTPSVQFKCYDTSEVRAQALYRALHDALHNSTGPSVLHAEEEGIGQTLEEPDTEWVFVLAFFTVMLRQA